jgi:hypothetical protein
MAGRLEAKAAASDSPMIGWSGELCIVGKAEHVDSELCRLYIT